jgi:hypothetical protein
MVAFVRMFKDGVRVTYHKTQKLVDTFLEMEERERTRARYLIHSHGKIKCFQHFLRWDKPKSWKHWRGSATHQWDRR